MDYIIRDKSIITGKGDLEHLYTFKNFPLFFGCVDSPFSQDLYADMEWGIDKETGVIQLTKLVPLDILYQEQHVDGWGPTWDQYYNDFAEYIVKQNPSSIFEIGGGVGKLALKILAHSPGINYTILEPNPMRVSDERIKIATGFFDENFSYPNQVETVMFSQVLEHAYNPKGFIEAAARLLQIGGKLIFAYPQLDLWLQRKYTNAINFEHTAFLTDFFVDRLLLENGFRIQNKEKYKDHSLFYTAERIAEPQSLVQFENKYVEYKQIFLDYIKYHKDLVEEINNKLITNQLPVYCFGAHIFTEYLLAFGLSANALVTVLDNSPLKQGRRLYGTNFIVASPHVLRGHGPVVVILKAGIYNEEIKKDILENINSEVIFW